MSDFEPYVGPRPFTSQDRQTFFGRAAEADTVLDLITAHGEVLIYSPSGAGKTSLLNAAVIPSLQNDCHDVLLIGRVSPSPSDVRSDRVRNRYVFDCIRAWTESHRDDPDEELLELSLRDFLKRRPRPNLDDPDALSLRVLIFDQFEDFFSSYPEAWNERGDFFQQVAEALEDDPQLRVVFVLRQDSVADIDPFSRILPERLRTRFHLDRMRKPAALEAAVKPLEQTNRRFAPGVAEKLVEGLMQISVRRGIETINIPGEFVEPVQLQVVCRQLWESLSSELEVIDEQFVQSYADTDKALSNYYDDCLRKISKAINIREGALRRWIEGVLITEAGTRASVFLDESVTEGLPSEAIAGLIQQHLVRTEFIRGARWIELSHDRFIKPIQLSNRHWRDSLDSTQTQRILEKKASEWARAATGVLDAGELFEAKRWLATPEAEELGISEALSSLIKASDVASEGRRKLFYEGRRIVRQRMLIWALILTIILLAVLVYALVTRQSRKERQFRDLTLTTVSRRSEALHELSARRPITGHK